MAVKTPPDTKAQIVILREAGYTLPLIAKKTGVSTSTIKRVLKRHPRPTSEMELNLVEDARAAMRAQFGSDDALGGLYAALLTDTLHHIETSREMADAALTKLRATDTADAALVFRALAAHSTALRGHVETVKALAPPPVFIDDLPTLRILTLTDKEVDELRHDQREYDDQLRDGGGH